MPGSNILNFEDLMFFFDLGLCGSKITNLEGFGLLTGQKKLFGNINLNFSRSQKPGNANWYSSLFSTEPLRGHGQKKKNL